MGMFQWRNFTDIASSLSAEWRIHGIYQWWIPRWFYKSSNLWVSITVNVIFFQENVLPIGEIRCHVYRISSMTITDIKDHSKMKFCKTSFDKDDDVDDDCSDDPSQIDGRCWLRAGHIFIIAGIIFIVTCVLLGMTFHHDHLKGIRTIAGAFLALAVVLMATTGIVCAVVELKACEWASRFAIFRGRFLCCMNDRERALQKAIGNCSFQQCDTRESDGLRLMGIVM